MFTAPANDGGSPITSAAATCVSSDGGASGSASAAGSPLTVNGLTNGHHYTCTVTVTSALGTSMPSAPSASTFVGTVPSAPEVGVVAPRNLSLKVAFSAPASDGGSPITAYTASCTSSDGGASGSGSATGSPIIVNGLTNGRTYRCNVTATNSVGTGPPSAASNTAVPAETVPDPPQLLVVFVNNGSLLVAFAPPTDDGGSAITGYRVACVSSDGGVARARAGAASPIAVKGLTNGKRYACSVTARNAFGAGGASHPSRSAVVGAPRSPYSVVVSARPTTAARGSVSVRFAAGADNGSPVTQFSVLCLSTDGGVPGGAVRKGSHAAPITVKRLTTGRTYLCVVSATNARGTGRPSWISAPVVVGASA